MKKDYDSLNNLSLKKSNEMISAKYKSTLLENQVMSIALTRIETNSKNPNAPLEARLYPGELKQLIGDPAHIYRTLRTLSDTMTGHNMVIEDGNGNFKAFAIVTDAEYVNGVFTVRFNDKLKSHIMGLERNYTTLELSVLTNFKKNSSFRLYELLKKEIYKSRESVNCGRVDVEYNISELKFMIGLANSDDQSIKNAMGRMSGNVDWDVLYDMLDKKDKKYESWRDFQKYVIKVAQEELEDKSNIRFDYTAIREGRKIKRIRFEIYPNKPLINDELLKRQQIIDEGKERQLERLVGEHTSVFKQLEGHNGLGKDDIVTLLKKASFDDDKVLKAVELADKQDYIVNYLGWLIKCIEGDYGNENIEVISGEAERAAIAKEVRDDYNSSKEEVADAIWNRSKQNEDFANFESELIEKGLTIDMFELIYTKSTERFSIYCNWKKGKGLNF